MMSDILSLLYKESKEYLYDFKSIIKSFVMLNILPLISIYLILPKIFHNELIITFFYTMLFVKLCSQLSHSSFSREILNRTIDILLTINIARWKIVLSKIMIPIGIAAVFPILSISLFEILNQITASSIYMNLIKTYLLLLDVGILASCLASVLTIFFPTNKVIGNLFSICIYWSMYYIIHPDKSLFNLILFTLFIFVITLVILIAEFKIFEKLSVTSFSS
jgi:hypothetical protein